MTITDIEVSSMPVNESPDNTAKKRTERSHDPFSFDISTKI